MSIQQDDTYSPWGEVAALTDVLIAWGELPSGHGWWLPESRVILLSSRLRTQAERRCVLAHELEHVRNGDGGVDDCSVLRQRQEYRANAGAARRLISLSALVDALLWTLDEQELAEELHVTVGMVQTRLANLTSDEHDYIDAKLWEREGEIA